MLIAKFTGNTLDLSACLGERGLGAGKNRFMHHSRDASLIKGVPTQPTHRPPRCRPSAQPWPGSDMPALVPVDSTYGAMLIGAVLAVWWVQSLSQQLIAYEPSGCLEYLSYNFTYISLVFLKIHHTSESSYVRL